MPKASAANQLPINFEFVFEDKFSLSVVQIPQNPTGIIQGDWRGQYMVVNTEHDLIVYQTITQDLQL